MKSTVINTKNATFQKFEVLKFNRNKRFKYGEFFVEGVRNINEAIEKKWEIVSFIYSKDKKLSKWANDLLSRIRTKENYALSDSLMKEISSKEDTSEILAIVKMKQDELLMKFEGNPFIILLDRPSNKGNLGTIIRSCDALGVDEIIITGHAVDPYEPDVISSTMGSFFSVPFARVSDNHTLFEYFNILKNQFPNLQLIGTTSHNQNVINELDFTAPTVLMIGNETTGLNNTLKEICDKLATIPMNSNSSASSFNIACATTVFLYEVCRQRNFQ